jgi:putative hydrolase of the HAD superfamily
MISDGIIFDGDDTLWETAPLYTRAKEEFFARMAALGFDPLEVQKTFQLIDVANVDRFGFSKERFPTSMAETYRLFCQKHETILDLTIETAMRNIGNSVFNAVPTPCDSAEFVLNCLVGHYKLILATKGDREIQRAKIERSNLARFFDAIYILDRKTAQDIERITEECELRVRTSWVIGDSLRSDINPALEVGLNAIWIPKSSWAYEDDIIPKSDQFYKLHELSDSLSLLIRERH